MENDMEIEAINWLIIPDIKIPSHPPNYATLLLPNNQQGNSTEPLSNKEIQVIKASALEAVKLFRKCTVLHNRLSTLKEQYALRQVPKFIKVQLPPSLKDNEALQVLQNNFKLNLFKNQPMITTSSLTLIK